MKYADVRGALARLGRELGGYHQGQQARAVNMQHAVPHGMCTGACREWLRLVLHGANGSAGPDALRSANIFNFQDNDTYEPFKQEKLRELQGQSQQYQDATFDYQQRANAIRDGIVQLRDHLTSGKISQAEFDKRVEQMRVLLLGERNKIAQAFPDSQKRNFQRLVTEDNKSAKTLRGQTKMLMELFWTEFNSQLDRRYGVAGQQFSGLKVIKVSPFKYYQPNGSLALINKVTAENKWLNANCGALLNVTAEEAEAGHAVAIHRRNNGIYHFFDPNFGIYEFTHENLAKAVRVLFERAYGHMEDFQSADNHPFENNGRVGGDFIIYEGPGGAMPGLNNHPARAVPLQGL